MLISDDISLGVSDDDNAHPKIISSFVKDKIKGSNKVLKSYIM